MLYSQRITKQSSSLTCSIRTYSRLFVICIQNSSTFLRVYSLCCPAESSIAPPATYRESWIIQLSCDYTFTRISLAHLSHVTLTTDCLPDRAAAELQVNWLAIFARGRLVEEAAMRDTSINTETTTATLATHGNTEQVSTVMVAKAASPRRTNHSVVFATRRKCASLV